MAGNWSKFGSTILLFYSWKKTKRQKTRELYLSTAFSRSNQRRGRFLQSLQHSFFPESVKRNWAADVVVNSERSDKTRAYGSSPRSTTLIMSHIQPMGCSGIILACQLNRTEILIWIAGLWKPESLGIGVKRFGAMQKQFPRQTTSSGKKVTREWRKK